MKIMRCFITEINSKRYSKGASMIMALVTMLLLVVLGLAVVSLSSGSITVSAGDNTNNKAYYAADAGVQSAIEQVKYEVSDFYTNRLLKDNASDYSSDYNDFFNKIMNNAASHFAQPVINGFSINTAFTLGTFNSTDNTQPLLISCVSKAIDGTQYKVNGSVTVKRVDVGTNSQWLIRDGQYGNAAIMVGGTLNLGNNSGITADSANAIVGNITNTNRCSLKGGAQLVINPAIGASINNPLKYPSYTTPTMSSSDLNITTNNYTMTGAKYSSLNLTTADGINMTLSNCTISSGIVYVKGNLTITGGGPYSADIYCDGNLTISNVQFNGKVCCRGNLSITSGQFTGSVRCDGSVTMNNGSYVMPIMAGGSVTISQAGSIGSIFAGGNISIGNANLSGGVIYSRTGVSMGSMSATAIVFSGGDVTLTGGGSITGSVIAKKDIKYSPDGSWYTVTYNSSNIDTIVSKTTNIYFFSGSTPTLGKTDVITGQSITPSGRVN